LVLCAGLFVAFAVYGVLSEGTHNDDDVGRYLNVRAAFQFPEQFISRWNRPAFVILYALPAQLGYGAVEILTALLSAATCFLVTLCARRLGERYAPLAALFTAVQPFFLRLSFSALTEPLAAFLLALSFYLLISRRNVLCAAAASAIPLARLELALILIPMAVRLWRDGSRRSLLVLPLGLAVWNLAGFLATGDLVYLFHESFTGAERIYKSVPWNHYLTGYIYIVGPVVFLFSILGLVDSLRRRDRLVISSSVLITIAALSLLSSSLSSAGQAAGFLRHAASISPFVALLALRGFNGWLVRRPSVATVLFFVGAAVVVRLYLSVSLEQGMFMGEGTEFKKFAAVSALAAATVARRLFPRPFEKAPARRILLGSVVLLCVAYPLKVVKVIRLTPEQAMMKNVAAWYRDNALGDRVTMCNHIWFHFFSGTNRLSTERFPHLTHAHLDAAPLGSLAIWESHYAHRLTGDVTVDGMEGKRQYRLIRRFLDSENRTFAAVFEKTSDGTTGEGRFEATGYRHPGLGVRWDLEDLGPWQVRLVKDEVKLLEGRDGKGAAIQVEVERFLRLRGTEEAYYMIEDQLSKKPEMSGLKWTDGGDWRWIRVTTGGKGLLMGIRPAAASPEALIVACAFPLPREEEITAGLADLVRGLRFDPAALSGSQSVP